MEPARALSYLPAISPAAVSWQQGSRRCRSGRAPAATSRPLQPSRRIHKSNSRLIINPFTTERITIKRLPFHRGKCLRRRLGDTPNIKTRAAHPGHSRSDRTRFPNHLRRRYDTGGTVCRHTSSPSAKNRYVVGHHLFRLIVLAQNPRHIVADRAQSKTIPTKHRAVISLFFCLIRPAMYSRSSWAVRCCTYGPRISRKTSRARSCSPRVEYNSSR